MSLTMISISQQRGEVMQRFLSAAQVARRFNVTSRTVVRWIDEGLLPGAFKANPDVTNSPYLIPVAVVDSFAEDRKSEELGETDDLEVNIVQDEVN